MEGNSMKNSVIQKSHVVLTSLLLVGFLSHAGEPEWVGRSEMSGGQPSSMAPAQATAVTEVKVITTDGCNAADPTEAPCPKPSRTEVQFTVEVGGPCHNYSARVSVTPDNQYLTIFDTPIPNCSRPEEKEYRTQVVARGIPARGSLRVTNPVYVKVIQAH
jgi:hypothetical protein